MEQARERAKVYKSPSDELRSAEAKRANAAKWQQKANDEAKKVFEAEQELAIRKAKNIAEQAEADKAVEEADEELEKRKRAVAHPTGVVVPDAQAASLAEHAVAANNALAKARAVAQEKGESSLDPGLRAVLDAVFAATESLIAGVPSAMRHPPPPPLPGDGAWTTVGPGGKRYREENGSAGSMDLETAATGDQALEAK